MSWSKSQIFYLSEGSSARATGCCLRGGGPGTPGSSPVPRVATNCWYPRNAAGVAHPCKHPPPDTSQGEGTDSQGKLAWRRCCWAPGQTRSPSPPRAAAAEETRRVTGCPHPPHVQRSLDLKLRLKGPAAPLKLNSSSIFPDPQSSRQG